jgi:hypothetical protein
MTNDDRLCWETGIKNDAPPPPELWRVSSIRDFAGRPLRHTNWFVTIAAAREHADWIEQRGGQVLSVARYICDQANHNPTETT